MSFNSTDEYQKFETLFKQYYSGLVVYASRFTGNTENAERDDGSRAPVHAQEQH